MWHIPDFIFRVPTSPRSSHQSWGKVLGESLTFMSRTWCKLDYKSSPPRQWPRAQQQLNSVTCHLIPCVTQGKQMTCGSRSIFYRCSTNFAPLETVEKVEDLLKRWVDHFKNSKTHCSPRVLFGLVPHNIFVSSINGLSLVINWSSIPELVLSSCTDKNNTLQLTNDLLLNKENTTVIIRLCIDVQSSTRRHSPSVCHTIGRL